MEKVADRTLDMLEKLAGQLGVTVELLWKTLLRQAYISSILDLVFSVGFFILLVVWFVFFLRFVKWAQKNENEYSDIVPVGWTAFIAGGVLLMVVNIIDLAYLTSVISALLNPEYWAFDKLMGMLQKLPVGK